MRVSFGSHSREAKASPSRAPARPRAAAVKDCEATAEGGEHWMKMRSAERAHNAAGSRKPSGQRGDGYGPTFVTFPPTSAFTQSSNRTVPPSLAGAVRVV